MICSRYASIFIVLFQVRDQFNAQLWVSAPSFLPLLNLTRTSIYSSFFLKPSALHYPVLPSLSSYHPQMPSTLFPILLYQIACSSFQSVLSSTVKMIRPFSYVRGRLPLRSDPTSDTKCDGVLITNSYMFTFIRNRSMRSAKRNTSWIRYHYTHSVNCSLNRYFEGTSTSGYMKYLLILLRTL